MKSSDDRESEIIREAMSALGRRSHQARRAQGDEAYRAGQSERGKRGGRPRKATARDAAFRDAAGGAR